MGDIEVNKCNVCGRETQINRKYYRYDIKCDCCNSKEDDHFEIVFHCKNCIPIAPKRIVVHLEPKK